LNNQVNISFFFSQPQKSAKSSSMSEPQAQPAATMSRLELEFMRLGLEEEIAGLQTQLDWVENAIAQLEDEP
jgi:hypothetical protein